MTDAGNASDLSKRERSPSFPYIGLTKAIERTGQLYATAKRFDVLLTDAAKAWGMQPKSSSTLQTAAALLSYGLIEDSGSGVGRKLKVTEAGARILSDARPGVREQLQAEAALKPKLISEYAAKWSEGRPDDHFCISDLKFEKGFSDEAAERFLKVFDETIGFTKQPISDKKNDKSTAEVDPPHKAKVGDFIQWTSGGVDQFATPACVIAISDDEQWVWVAESQTGIPMNEVTIQEAPSGNTPPPMPAGVLAAINAAKQKVQSGIREEKFALKEGDVTLTFPEGLSSDSVEDLDAYLKVFLKKVKRVADATKSEN